VAEEAEVIVVEEAEVIAEEEDGLTQVSGNVTAATRLDTWPVTAQQSREKDQPEVRSKAYAHRLCTPSLSSPASTG
jgi:hypothetical protein